MDLDSLQSGISCSHAFTLFWWSKFKVDPKIKNINKMNGWDSPAVTIWLQGIHFPIYIYMVSNFKFSPSTTQHVVQNLVQYTCIFSLNLGVQRKTINCLVGYHGQFVCDSSYLKVGHWVQGLLADKELERREFYFFLPIELLYSLITYEEMSSLNYKSARETKHASFNNLGNIFPVFSEFW
jgi:hypothetical protein